jgi:hypothetical protein
MGCDRRHESTVGVELQTANVTVACAIDVRPNERAGRRGKVRFGRSRGAVDGKVIRAARRYGDERSREGNYREIFASGRVGGGISLGMMPFDTSCK